MHNTGEETGTVTLSSSRRWQLSDPHPEVLGWAPCVPGAFGTVPEAFPADQGRNLLLQEFTHQQVPSFSRCREICHHVCGTGRGCHTQTCLCQWLCNLGKSLSLSVKRDMTVPLLRRLGRVIKVIRVKQLAQGQAYIKAF